VVVTFGPAALPAPPPDPSPINVQWFGCDLSSGRVAEELTGSLAATGVLSRRLGAYASTTFGLTLAGAPSGWEAATDPGRTMLVCVADGTPVWAGIPLPRSGGSADTVGFTCVTPEAYLDRRYVGDHTWTQQDEASVIAAGLLGDALDNGPAMTIDAPATGTKRDRTYADADDATVYSRMQDLMGLEDGPEWTIDVVQTGVSTFGLVGRVRKKIGAQVTTPGAWFTLPGELVEYQLAESYESGKGATSVRARGEGEGDTRYTSSDHIATGLIAAGWPLYEYRYTPSTSIKNNATLDSHAAGQLALMQQGARVWTATAVASRAPRIGRDWNLGDPLGLHIITSPRHPAGVEVVARAWGWDWDVAGDRVSPVLVEE